MTSPQTLAAGTTAAHDVPPGDAFVLARLADRSVALPMAALLEIADLGEVAPAPLAPSWLLGVTNLRGVVVPVVDLAVLLGWPARESGRRALVLRDGRFRLAVPMQAVQSVRWLEVAPPEAEVGPPPLARIWRTEDEVIWIVDAGAVLARVRQG